MPDPDKSGGAARGAGDAGEAFAAECLETKGYRIIARNFRTRMGEIDIIARDAQFLVFAEVKARKPGSMVRPEEAVDLYKQRRLRYAAEYYLAGHPTPLQPRFDVMCVELSPQGFALTNWIEDAF